MNALELLKAARAKIEKPENWTQGSYAKNKEGFIVDVDDDDACKFCSVGALLSHPKSPNACVIEAREYLRRNVAGEAASIISFNDSQGRTHAEVLAVFDRTIAQLEAE